MSRRTRSGLIAAGVAVIVLGSSCAASPGSEPDSANTSAGALRAAGLARCPTTSKLPEPEAQPVPPDFLVDWVLRCGVTMRAVPGDGKWWFRTEERADTDAAALLAALRRPDEQAPPAGTVCRGVAIGVPYFALVDESGTVVHPRVPLDRCRQPQQQALDALKALPFRETNATRLNQEQSQASIDTGCGQMWTDAPAGDMLLHTKPVASRRLWRKTPDAVRICLWQPRASGLPELVSARKIAGADLAALLTRLEHLPAARPCTTRHRRFAVLEYIRRGWHDSAAYAEIDGCRMILRPDNTLGQLDPATAKLLTTLSHR